MRRREFITLVGSAVAAWPLTAFGKTQRIAIVAPSLPVGKMTETSGTFGARASTSSSMVDQSGGVGRLRAGAAMVGAFDQVLVGRGQLAPHSLE